MIGTLVVALSVFRASGLLVDSSDDLFGKILYNVQKQIDFFAADYSDINVDGLFGLRMAQGAWWKFRIKYELCPGVGLPPKFDICLFVCLFDFDKTSWVISITCLMFNMITKSYQ
jgi:hypothetical protein